MKNVRDGWHKVYGYDVWVEDGWAVRGLSGDGQRPLYIYSVAKGGGYDLRDGVKLDALRKAMARGTMALL